LLGSAVLLVAVALDQPFALQARIQYNGRQPRALLIGTDSLAIIEQILTERNSRPMTLKEVGFSAGRKLTVIMTDDESPNGVTVVIKGQYF
jgi:hypothetical protein